MKRWHQEKNNIKQTLILCSAKLFQNAERKNGESPNWVLVSTVLFKYHKLASWLSFSTVSFLIRDFSFKAKNLTINSFFDYQLKT